MLEVKELYFRHKDLKEDTLKDIKFLAESGKVTVILGPNGSGKSTLFKCIIGIWKPYKGSIYANGKEINKLSYLERAKIFSVIPQEHEITFPYSVFDMVITGRAPYIGLFSCPKKRDYEKTEIALKVLGIYHLKDKPYNKISGGERQLVLIARALAQSAPFMLLDEPVSHLDFRNQIKVLLKIKELTYKNKITALVTLHDPNLASFFADKLVVIKNGKIVAEGKPQEILNEKLIEEVYGIKINLIQNNGFNLICPVLDFLTTNNMEV